VATQVGDTISVRYTGKLLSGTVFDSNADGLKEEFNFQLGAGEVIKGWDIGPLGVNVGDVVILSIPADQAYGSIARGQRLHSSQ
jgi:FK506-binding nuclear protein